MVAFEGRSEAHKAFRGGILAERAARQSLKCAYCAWSRNNKKASEAGAIGVAEGVVGLARFKRLRAAILSMGACGPLSGLKASELEIQGWVLWKRDT